ncbi:MAG: GGDEF domain-containing protein [Solirubrobacterales bacterium]
MELASENVTVLETAALFALAMSLVSLGSGWHRVARPFYIGMATAMTLDVAAIYYFGGSLRGEFSLLFTFVVVFTAYFFPRRVVASQLVLIAALMAGRVFVMGVEDLPAAEIVRMWMLVPALVLVAWLVSFLRARVEQREVELRAQSSQDVVSGLLSAIGFGRKLEEELARASAAGVPATVVVVELGGKGIEGDSESSARLERTVGRAIAGRLRPDDHAARIGELRFAIVAPGCDAHAGRQQAAQLAEAVRERMMQLGYTGEGLEISIGCASFPQDASLPEDLLPAAVRAMAALPLQSGRPEHSGPPVQSAPASTRSATVHPL